MILVGKKDDFSVYFNANSQSYTVFKGKLLLTNKFRFIDIKSYLD